MLRLIKYNNSKLVFDVVVYASIAHDSYPFIETLIYDQFTNQSIPIGCQ